MSRYLAILGVALLGSFSSADISYTVNVNPEKGILQIKIEVPGALSGITMKSPNWAPGSYRLVDNYRNVTNLKAVDGNNQDLSVTQTTNAWRVNPADKVTITYEIANAGNNGAWHWSGPSTYLYVEGRKEEECILKVTSPANWQAHTGLDEMSNKTNVFEAADYDVLADNPVSIGNVTVDTYRYLGKPHYIVYRNAGIDQIDREKVSANCLFVTKSQADFFGGLPVNKFVFHFSLIDAVDGGGGLEHLSSTQITLPTGFGRWSQTVIPHEYFHLWNVKRIRSYVLGPFDYDKLPRTGALWWLEGVTDYYAHLLLMRYGYWGRDQFYEDIRSNSRTYGTAAARLTNSIHDASFKVADAANGRGNSQGFGFSYYDAGWVAGMMLDIEIRSRTNNRRSLDDVELALWRMTENDQPGFQEDEIRKQVIKFGGADIAEFYDNLIGKAGEKDIAGSLKKVGLRLVETGQMVTTLGFTATPAEGGLTVRSVTDNAVGKLERGDIILKIGGVEVGKTRRFQTEAMTKAQVAAVNEKPMTISFKRADKTFDVEVVSGIQRRQIWKVEEDPGATREQIQLRDAWLYTKGIK